MNPIKLFWATHSNETHIGNYYGYRVHNENLRKFAEQHPLIIVTDNWEEADACLFITTPENFKERPPKPTFLFTMFEGTNLPEIYIENLKKTDFIITPSHWVKDLFKNYFPADKTFVVPHGVEEVFTYHKRKRYPKCFRFLWVGAANPRKGYQELIIIWDKLGLYKIPDIELYIKTTRVPNITIQRNRNVILDSRNLSKGELVELYHSANCFVFPSRGEGFGLTLAEAMATGLPCIATGRSGESEFFDAEVGYPVKYTLGMCNVKSWTLGELGQTEVAYPDPVDLAEKMLWVRLNYKKALVKGWEASIRIRRDFTWKKSAEKLYLVLKQGLEKLSFSEQKINI